MPVGKATDATVRRVCALLREITEELGAQLRRAGIR
jgi:hypothetical protein